MNRKLVEIRFKGGRPEPIVVDGAKKVLWMPGGNGGTVVVHNLHGDSQGRGKGKVMIWMRNIVTIRHLSGSNSYYASNISTPVGLICLINNVDIPVFAVTG